MNSLKEKIDAIVAEGMALENMVGANVLVLHKGDVIFRGCYGYADREKQVSMKEDTIFRLYSMSKPLTAVAAMIAMEKGLLSLSDPVSKYLPEYGDLKVYNEDGTVRPARSEMTVFQLLTMTSALCYPNVDTPTGIAMCKVFDNAKENLLKGDPTSTREYCRQIAGVPLDFDPGTRWAYGLSADVLGCIIEVASGRSFGRFLQEEVFEPLEMWDTGFFVPKEKWHRLAQWYLKDEITGKLNVFDDIHLGVGKYDEPPLFESGGAGLVSTMEDFNHFAQMMLNGGNYKGRQILRPETIKTMSADHLAPQQKVYFDWDSVKGCGYGFLMRVLLNPKESGTHATFGDFGWDGWTGTYISMNPEKELAVIYLIQRVASGTTPEVMAIKNAVYDEILC